MKILAFSDLHRDAAVATTIVSLSRDADVVVGQGISRPPASALRTRSPFFGK